MTSTAYCAILCSEVGGSNIQKSYPQRIAHMDVVFNNENLSKGI